MIDKIMRYLWWATLALGLLLFAWLYGYAYGVQVAYDVIAPGMELLTAEIKAADALIKEAQARIDQLTQELEAARQHISRKDAVISAATACGMSPEAAEALWAAGKVYGVPHGLLIAVAQVESECRSGTIHTNRNGSTDHGLFQLNSGTWPWLARMTGRSDPHDESDNIHMGAWYLAYLRARHDTLHEALTAYNRGEGGMRLYQQHHGTAESDYSRAVLSKWEGQ